MSEAIKKKTKKSSEKKQRKFLFVDFLIILLILAIVGGAVYLFSPGSFLNKTRKSTEGTLIYTVEIKGVSKDYLNKIQENDVVVHGATKSAMGTVSAVDYTNNDTVLDYVWNEKEEAYVGTLVPSPDQYSVLVTITASADYVAEDGYFVNNTRVAVGEGMALRFPNFAVEGYCISVIPQNFN